MGGAGSATQPASLAVFQLRAFPWRVPEDRCSDSLCGGRRILVSRFGKQGASAPSLLWTLRQARRRIKTAMHSVSALEGASAGQRHCARTAQWRVCSNAPQRRSDRRATGASERAQPHQRGDGQRGLVIDGPVVERTMVRGSTSALAGGPGASRCRRWMLCAWASMPGRGQSR